MFWFCVDYLKARLKHFRKISFLKYATISVLEISIVVQHLSGCAFHLVFSLIVGHLIPRKCPPAAVCLGNLKATHIYSTFH